MFEREARVVFERCVRALCSSAKRELRCSSAKHENYVVLECEARELYILKPRVEEMSDRLSNDTYQSATSLCNSYSSKQCHGNAICNLIRLLRCKKWIQSFQVLVLLRTQHRAHKNLPRHFHLLSTQSLKLKCERTAAVFQYIVLR